MNRIIENGAIAITVLYSCFLIGFIANPKSSFWAMSLNEMGDFLAGAVGPVALLWLVKGYAQQNSAISIQSHELKAAVDQHKAQVKATSTLAEHDLRLARIDYYRLVAENAGIIRECDRFLKSEDKNTWPFAMAKINALDPLRLNKKFALKRNLKAFQHRQAQIEAELDSLEHQPFEFLELKFRDVVQHGGEARTFLQEVENYSITK